MADGALGSLIVRLPVSAPHPDLLLALSGAPSSWREVGCARPEVCYRPGMTQPITPSYAGHRFPPEVISHAVWPYYCCVTSQANPLMPLDNPGRVFWPEKAAESKS